MRGSCKPGVWGPQRGPGVWGPQWGPGVSAGSRDRAPVQQSRHSMDAWQKWTLVVSLGAQNAGGGKSTLAGTLC